MSLTVMHFQFLFKGSTFNLTCHACQVDDSDIANLVISKSFLMS